MNDDLGKRVTQVPGFEWKLGMAVAGEYGELVINRAPYGYHGGKCEDDAELQLETKEWIYAKNAALDLGHDANTGFLLKMLMKETLCPQINLDEQEVCCNAYEVVEHYGENEHINHALARAIIAASEEDHEER